MKVHFQHARSKTATPKTFHKVGRSHVSLTPRLAPAAPRPREAFANKNVTGIPSVDADYGERAAIAIGPFAQGLAPAGCKGRWGFIDRQGAWAVRPLYRMTQGFHDGFGTVALASGEAHIRADGTPIDFAASEIDTAPVDEAPCGAPLAAGAK